MGFSLKVDIMQSAMQSATFNHFFAYCFSYIQQYKIVAVLLVLEAAHCNNKNISWY